MMTASQDVVAAAKKYSECGYAIVPVQPDKKPFGDNWRRRFELDEVLDRLRGPHCVAIGFLGGDLNNNIVPLDFDTAQGEGWWRDKCLAAGIDPDDFPTVITPGKLRNGVRAPGRHRYVRDVRGTLGNAVGDMKNLGIDVRGRGHTMLPPSPHPDGGNYRWLDRHGLDDFDIIPPCPDFIYEAVTPAPRAERLAGSSRPVSADDRAQRYAAAALIAQCDIVRSAPPGQRNATLNNAALSMGHQVGAGRIGRRQVEAALLDAADACGLVAEDGERGCRATIKSGLDKGEAEPAEPLEDTGFKAKANGTGTAQHEDPPQSDAKRSFPYLSYVEFTKGFVAPNFVIQALGMQRGFCYSFTGATGSGKTAVSLLLMAYVSLGKSIAGKSVDTGRTLMLSGENPDDVRMRCIGMAEQMGFAADEIPMDFIPGVFSIRERFPDIAHRVNERGGVSLICVDTAPAYFAGEDENSNKELGDHARMLRDLAKLPGNPCVLANCHPVKNAAHDNLLPRGGGAFLNEVDGNLTCVKTDTSAEVHWQGKFRGPEFEPVSFDLLSVTSPLLVSQKGDKIFTVVARTISKLEQESREGATLSDLTILLRLVQKNGRMTLSDYAEAAGWFSKSNEPYKMKVKRLMGKLIHDRLVSCNLGVHQLTQAGLKVV